METISILQDVSEARGIGGRIMSAMTRAAEIIGMEGDLLEQQILSVPECAPSDVGFASRHILEAGGKRIRPALCLLAYRTVGGRDSLPLDLAVACELVHNATLLHDDVIDGGEMRRGRPSARVVFGNAISVLAGDHLLVRTIERVAPYGRGQMDLLVETLDKLVKGEVTQLKRRGSIDTTEDEYFSIIEGKTASLFRWAAMSGSLAGGASPDVAECLGVFGWHVGIAFQIMDDVLDYTADEDELGKGLLSDISEGKMTLPAILAVRRSSKMRALLTDLAAGEESPRLMAAVRDIIDETNAAGEAKRVATQHTEKALEALSGDSGFKNDAVNVLKDLALALLDRAS